MCLRRKLLLGGFSIVELMAVVVIIGILGVLGINRYYAFIARARQAEARVNLKLIGDLQETYKYEHEEFESGAGVGGVGAFSSGVKKRCSTPTPGKYMKNQLGFRPKDCDDLRYGYTWDADEAIAESTTNDGKLIFPGCPTGTDKWEKDHDTNDIENTDDVIKKCGG